MFLQPLGFLIYMTAGVAETNRAPFDFPEAEQELVAGYHTEYSSMSFALFFLAEYINMVTVSAVATDLYPRRLARAVPARRGSAGSGSCVKVGVAAVLLHLDALDAAALPLRPADGSSAGSVLLPAGGRSTCSSTAARVLYFGALRRSLFYLFAALAVVASLLVIGAAQPDVQRAAADRVVRRARRASTCCSTRRSSR